MSEMQEINDLAEEARRTLSNGGTTKSTGLNFPTAPADGTIHSNYVYDSVANVWKAVPR